MPLDRIILVIPVFETQWLKIFRFDVFFTLPHRKKISRKALTFDKLRSLIGLHVHTNADGEIGDARRQTNRQTDRWNLLGVVTEGDKLLSRPNDI